MIPENALLSKFTLIEKKTKNTFQHVLYLIHRDYLHEQDILVTRTLESDYAGVKDLMDSTGDSEDCQKEVLKQIEESVDNTDSPWLSFTARVGSSVVASFLIAKEVNLNYYRSHFHVQD